MNIGKILATALLAIGLSSCASFDRDASTPYNTSHWVPREEVQNNTKYQVNQPSFSSPEVMMAPNGQIWSPYPPYYRDQGQTSE